MSRSCAIVLIASAVVLSFGCDQKQPAKSVAAADALPAVLAPVRAAFDLPLTPTADLKAPWFERSQRVTKRLSENRRELEAAVDYLATAAADDPDPFRGTLHDAVLWAFLSREKHDGLARALANLPYFVDGPDGRLVEYAIVDPDESRPVTDILVLFDAYDQATVPKVRESLVSAVRRAFSDRIRTTETDSEVMERCRREFQIENYCLKVNKAYAQAYVSGWFDVGNSVPAPLFIPSSGPDRVERKILTK